MEVALQLNCPCKPNFIYKNPGSFSAHKKTKMHIGWENTQTMKNDKARSKEFENEVERLKRSILQKEAIEAELLKRIQHLESALKYYEGVYIN